MLILFVASFIARTSVVQSEALPLTAKIETKDTIHVYPSTVANGAWAGVENVLTPDLSEDAIYQDFSARNAAYVPLSSAVVPQVNINAESGTIPAVNATTTASSSMSNTPLIPLPGDQTPPVEPLPQSPQNAEPSAESVQQSSDTSEVPPQPVSLKKATENFFTIFSAVTRFLPFALLSDTQATPTAAGSEAVPVSEAMASDTPAILPDQAVTGETATTANENATSSIREPLPSASPDESTSSPTNASVATSSNEASDTLTVTPPGSKTITLSDFSTPELSKGEYITSMQLRLSLAAKYIKHSDTEAPVITITYRTPSSTQEVGRITLDDEISNALNGGYFLFALPNIADVSELAHASVEVTYSGDTQSLDGMYLDAAWLELNVAKVDPKLLKAKEAADLLKRMADPKLSTMISTERDFTREEAPRFSLRYQSQRNVVVRFVRNLLGRPLLQVDGVSVSHNGDGQTNLVPQVSVTQDGLVNVDFSDADKAHMEPGEYTVELHINEGGSVYTDSFTFQWGVLSINPDKTSYALGESANFSMGALSQNGNTICDADLSLYITDENDNAYAVPVAPSGECQGNNVVAVPDYSATFTPTLSGTYTMHLERLDADGNIIAHTEDTFLVEQDLPLSIRRVGPSRIYPDASYPMSLTVLSEAPWKGTLIEQVPATFDITDTDAKITKNGDTLLLSWDIDTASALSQTVSYTFNAPDLSPYLYTVGTASLVGESPGKMHVTDMSTTQEATTSSITTEAGQEEVIATSSNPTDTMATGSALISATTTSGTAEGGGQDESIIQKILDIFHIGGSDGTTTQTGPQGTSTPANVSTQPATSSVQNDQATGSTVTSGQETPVQSASSSGLEGNVTPSDQLALTLSSTSTDASSSSSTRDVVFSEHRVWQIASDATGNMILYWDGGTTLPSGWTCLSCGSGTFYQKFVMGDATYNTTGGSATTTPSASATVLAQSDPAVAVNTPGTGAGFALDTHTHTFTPTINGASNLPSYRQLRVIEYTAAAGEPPTIPTGAIGIFDTSVPAGWTQYSAENNRYVYGGNSPGTTGGSNTVSHTVSGTFGAAGGTVYRVRTGGTQVSVSTSNHTHTISTTTPAIDHQPPFITAIFGKLNATTTPPNGMVSMWTNTVPGGWLDESSAPTGAFYKRFILASSTYGVTGGTTTRTVADINGIVSSGPSATTNSRTGANQNAADTSHTHLVNVTGFSSETNLPPYLTAIFGKRIGSGPIYTQVHYQWFVNANAQTPTDPWSSDPAVDLAEDEQISATSTPVKNGDVVRLRIDVADSNATSTVGSTFKLQYGAGTVCSAVASWSDVGGTASSSIWRGYDNTSVSNASSLSSTTLASTTVGETYQEDARATSSVSIPVNGIGEWDFSLQQNGAAANTQYCFRMVQANGSAFLSYANYPTLITNTAPNKPTLSIPFDNEQATSTLPGYTFFASDPESDDLDYEVQISTSYTFASTVEDKSSVTNSLLFTNVLVPSNKAPFTAGQSIQFTPSVALTNGTTYWWRVRAKDSAGSATWGGWSTPHSYTVNSSVSASSWFQTTQDQFNEATLAGTITNGSGYVSLATGSTTGTTTSPTITFENGTHGTAWKDMKVNKNVTVGTLIYRLQYLTSTSSWANVPDADLPGNAAGFSTSSVSLLNLDTATYNKIRLVAKLTNVGGSPQLLDWTVDWGYRVNTPTILSPFDNEKISSTTPNLTFTTTDPLGKDLTYQVSWSTSPDFTASTTRTSGTNAGFSNLDQIADTDPFNSGDTIQLHVQPADAFTNGTTYWWRVRAKDTTGNNIYSFWTDPQSFTVDTSVTVSTWFQTTSDQFNTDTLTGVIPIGAGSSSVATSAKTAMLVYGEGTNYQPKYRLWNGTSWGSQKSLASINSPLVRARVKAGTTRSEYVAATLGTDSDVNAQVYSNGTWANYQNITTNTGMINTRPFDVAYETISGRAMIVSCDNGTDPIYYLWDGSTWTSGGSITASTLTANCSWVQLISNPTSNEIILLMRATNATVYQALVWNGSSWGNSTTLNRSSQAANEGMAMQYEESANQALILGTNRTNNNYMWRSWSGSAWSGTTNQAIGNDFEWGQVINNVGNDLMTVCYQDASDHVGVVRWTGSAWTGQSTLQAGTGYAAADPGFSCVYEHDGTHNDNILLSYTTNTQTQYRTWNGAAWSAAAQINSMGPTVTSELERTGDGKILGVFFDDSNDHLLSANWSGTAWSTTQTLESDMPVNSTPFGLPYNIAPANPSTVGTLVGTPVIFSNGSGPYWKTFSWNDSKPGASTITYQLQYFDGSNWALIPDAALSGNSTGLTGPVDLSSLNHVTYNEIRPAATLACDGSGNCPSINDWTITWAAGITVSGTLKAYDETTDITSVATLDTAGTSSIIVPNNVTQITVKLWGAGGGGGGGGAAGTAPGGAGGGGGFTKATLTVTPGETLTLVNGNGGSLGTGDTTNGGGGGGGGGYTAIKRGATFLAIAAAGGGGGGGDDTTAMPGGAGGAGGGTTGANGVTAGTGIRGSGGTQTAGGAGGTGACDFNGTTGSARNGGAGGGAAGPGFGGAGGSNGGAAGGNGQTVGSGAGGGGGGGAGYYGGGGGCSDTTTDGTGGAGGGSSYIITTATATSTQSGSGTAAGNNADTDYNGTAGKGGNGGAAGAGNGNAGNPGLISVSYGPQTVAVAVNGVLQTGKTSLVNGGAWSIANVNAAPGSIVTAFVLSTSTSNEAVGVTRYDGIGDVTGMKLFQKHLTIGSDDATTTPVTNGDIALYDHSKNADIFDKVTGSTLYVCGTTGCGNAKLYIRTSAFYTPGGNTHLRDLVNHGTLSATSSLYLTGSWTNNATSTMTGNTVFMEATSTAVSIDSTGAAVSAFNNLTIGTTTGAATWNLATALSVNGNLSVKGGTLARGMQPITIGGNLSNQSSGLWSGSGTTTFNGASSATWSDANATLQNVGRVVIDGTAKSVTLSSNVKARSVKIGGDDFLNLGNSSYTLTDLGNFNNTHTLTAGNGTVQFAATTSTGVTLGGSALYNAAFSGSGSFAFTDSAISISHNLSIATGTVTLPTGTTTISGSFTITGGSFAHNNGVVYFNGSGSQSVTLLGTAFTNSLYNVKFGGSGTYTFTDANATTSHNFTKSAGTVVLPSGTLAVGGQFSNTSGSLTAGNNTLVLYGTGTSTVTASGATLGSVKSFGTGPYRFTDTNATLAHSLLVVHGTVILPTGTLTIGGSLTNTGAISAGTGSILFNAGTTGNTVDPGASNLHAITFNNAAGAWTITGNATTTGNTTLTAGTFTLQSGKTLHVSGTFSNAMNAASTTWTGSTLALSGGSYSINTKTSGSDTYSTIALTGSTHVSMWNSTVSTTTTDSSSSLYSQDNSGVDGNLYIWGHYTRSSGTEYWDYNKDFDGTPLTGSSTRAVHVYFNGGAYVTQTFTSNGTFTPPAGITKVDVLVVGGGGGGGAATGYTNAGAGGGGGGGVIYRSNYSVTPLTGIGITVGTGGTAGVGGNVSGGNGATSTFGSLTALGGGGGIGGNGNGKNGGSGGGARGGNGGTGTQPSSGSGGFGNRGGNSGGSPAGAAATGGGGAGGAGEDLAGVAGEKGGNGGAGLAYDISGISEYYGGGGGGGAAQTSSPVGTGGSGVGGNGGNNGTAPIAGSANTGGGGGGGNNARAGAAGGSGVVVVRYAINPSFTLTGGTLEMLGTSTASTSIAGIGGAYAFDVTGGTVNAKYYQVRNGDDNGFSLSGTPMITSLANGDFAIDGDGKTMITVSSTTINANPGLQILSVRFATSTGVANGYNVSQQDGTPSSYWWFRNTSGNFAGEAHDNDTGNPGSIRWDDSSLVLNVSGTVYSDDGVTPQAGGICDNVTNVIRLHVSSSGTNYDTHCSASNGTFTLSGVTITGSPILTLFLNGTAGSNKAVVVTKTPTGNITNADIYMHRVILRHEDTDPLTIADMAGYDSSNDADIVFTAATGTTPSLTTAGNTELYLWHGKSFSPGGGITLSHSGTGSTYDGSLYLAASSTFTGSGTTTYSIGGSWREAAGATFIPASTTITFVATSSGKTISGAASSTINFNALAFTGTGSWNVNSAIALTGDMHIASGTVTGTGNITLHSGSLYGNGLLSMGGGTTTIEKSNTLGGTQGWTFHNLTLGNGTTVGTTTPGSAATTTISGRLKIATGHFLNAGSSVFDLSGSGTVFLENGTFLEGTSKLRYSGSGATTILSTGYYDLDLNAGAGSPTYTATGLGIQVHHNLTVGGQSPTVVDLNANDPALAVTGNVLIRSNGTVGASGSGSFTVGGNWDNSGTFTGNSGTVTFNGSGSPTINAGASSFGNVLINGTGSFTLTDNATSTGAFTIATTTGALTLSSGKTLSVGGVFSNGLGGANTTWTGSTLYLHSGTNYAINTKSVSDTYDTLKVGANTDIRMWNSQASTYAIDPSGSLYSMDHAGVDGSLYIYGNYPGSGSTDYWSYAKDFDGTSLGSPRSTTVRFQSGASMDLVTGGLQVLGASGASTTIENQGSGNYRLHIGGSASTSWSYYKVYNTDSSGLTISGTPNVLTLSRGYFEVSQASGTAMTVGGTAINTNPAKTFTNDVFATTTAIRAFNVTATGTAVSSWRFTNHSGNLAGEAHDVDPDGDPGYIVWDDSAATITISGHVYSDEGSTVSAVCDGTTADIHIRVAGLTTYTGSCNASTGAYAISGISFSPGDSLIAYISGKAQKAAAVTRDPISNISDLDLYEHRVIVRHENTSALTIADMAIWDSSNDSDIPFTATIGSPNTLTLPSNTKLIVWGNKTFAPGGNMTLSGGGAGAAYDGSLEVYANGALTFAGTQSHSIGGSFVFDGGATFTPAQSTTTFTTTGAARTIDTNSTPFYNVAFTGSGSWSVTDPIFGIHTLVQSAGTLTLPTGTTTINGSWIKNGGSFVNNGSLMRFTATGIGNTVKFGGTSVASLSFSGVGGSWNMTDTNATSTGAITVVHGGLTLPPGSLALRGSFKNLGGTITHNSDDLIFEGTTTATLLASSSDLYTVRVNGSGGLTMADHSLTLANSLIINAGTTTLATGTLSIGGSLSAATGAFNNATGTILFNATTTGKTIDPGKSRFYNVNFGSAAGGWTISKNATSTHNLTISSANSFTLQSGKRLYVGGVFTNSVGGSATTWTGSTLVLGSGNVYSINTKSAGGDNYNTLIMGANTDISAWNSHATTTTIASSSSFYSMDHAGVDGSLYIYGDYHISTTTQYWSYAKDFDGTTLSGGSERAVTVHIAAGATTTLTSGTLSIIGAAGNETTITNQGSGNYAFNVTGGTLNAQYYKFRNLNKSGVSLSGSPTISNLSNGDFELAVSGGHLITLSSGVIDANASLVISGDRFATTTAITGYNVYLQGSTSNAWTFVSHTGNLAGEAFDFDGATACGSVRWSNSSCLITQETHYRYRNDDGGIGVQNSEWYNASWTERTTVRLTNNDATTYTNPVVHLHVTYDSDMNTNFSDLRFTDQSGTTSIPYYIEKYSTGSNADIWVKVPTLAGNATTPIFMYYKNISASTTTSSSTATFIASDSFEDGNISEYSGDTSLFSVNTNHVDGGTYGLDNAGNTTARATNGIARFDQTVSQGEQLRYKQYVNTSGGADEVCSMFGVQSPVTAIHNYGVCLEQVVGQDYMAIVKNVDHSAVPANTLASTSVTYSTGWYEVDINWKTDNSIFVSLYDSSGALVATTTATDSTYTSGGYGFTFWYNSGGWDSYFVRPVFTTEPTVHYGAKQTDGGATWASALDTPVTLSSGDAIRMRTSVENSGLQITNQTFDLEYAQKGAAPSCEAVSNANYATVPVAASCGSSPLCMATSSHVTNNSNTTDLLRGPSGDFTPGKVVTDPSYTTSALTLDQDAYTELEYVLKTTIHATSSAYCMRVTDGGTPVDTYLSVPELDIKFDPTVSALTLNGGQDITLTPGATTTIYATGTVSDFNGYSDLATATGTIYRSGAGALCSPNENDCYRATGAQCQFSNCSGNSCEISCQADINYFADPTDSGTYAGEEWIAYVEAADHEGGIGVGSAPGVELLSLRALNVSSAINYGSLAVASSTGAFNPTTTVANIGNSVLDLQVEGTDLSDGAASTIPASEQLFATSSFSYSACTYCTTLSTTSTQFNLDLTKPTSTAPVTGTIYWGIYVPFGVSAAAHHGTNTFYATGP